MSRLIALFYVWLHGKRTHHRHDMQEQNHIAHEWIGDVLTQKNFEVSPQTLRP